MNFSPFSYIRNKGVVPPVLSVDIGTGFNGTVNTVNQDSSGNIYCGGSFTSYNGTSVGNICRLFEDGTLDTSFNSGGVGFNGYVLTMLISGNNIWVGGSFTQYNGSNVGPNIHRFTIDGIRGTWGGGTNNLVRKIIFTPGFADLLFVGDFTTYRGNTRNRVVRCNQDGGFGAGFSANSNGRVWSVSGLNSNANVGFVGQFTTFNTLTRTRTCHTTNTGGSTSILLNVTDGTPVADLHNISGLSCLLVGDFNNGVRLTANPSFGGGFNNAVRALGPRTSTNVYVGGDFTEFDGINRTRVARLDLTTTSYTLDSTFNPPSFINDRVQSISYSSSNNRLWVAGDFNGVGTPNRLVCLDATTGENLTQFS